jgi:hypothetical protein
MGEGSSIFKNIQTTAVLPGGATIVEFTVDVPGKFKLRSIYNTDIYI